MGRVLAAAAALALLILSIGTSSAITIDTVTVGDAGNEADSTGYGSVAYDYNIGKYEVTAGQYTAFLNAVAATDTYGLYHGYMSLTDSGCGITRGGAPGNHTYSVATDCADRPVNYVGFWDACRFANWLGNGQPTGGQDASTTERGAYTLDGYIGYDGRHIQRNEGWAWAVTSEDEWYKAAYYKGGGLDAGYYLYPTSSDAAPGRDMADVSGNNANYSTGSGGAYPIEPGHFMTVAGEFQNSDSPYGTFDQGGNVAEWTEAISFIADDHTYRPKRGGSYYWGDPGEGVADMQSSIRIYNTTGDYEYTRVGFRVSQVVPEPSSMIALLGGLAGLVGLRRRKA